MPKSVEATRIGNLDHLSSSSESARWCIWLSRPPHTRKVGSSILSRVSREQFSFGFFLAFCHSACVLLPVERQLPHSCACSHTRCDVEALKASRSAGSLPRHTKAQISFAFFAFCPFLPPRTLLFFPWRVHGSSARWRALGGSPSAQGKPQAPHSSQSRQRSKEIKLSTSKNNFASCVCRGSK